MKRSTRNWWISAFIGIVLIATVSFLYIKQNRSTLYIDSSKKFSVRCPAGWEIRPKFQGVNVMFVSPVDGPLDIFQENVTVNIEENPDKLNNVREYADVAIKQMELVFAENFELVESTAVDRIDGESAYKVIFNGLGPHATLRYYMVWVIKDRMVFQITYTGIPAQFDLFFNDAESVVRSFRFI